MRSVSISELKARLSEHIRRVRGGERVLVTDRGVPVATLVPAKEVVEHPELQDLIERGLIRPPKGKLPDGFWDLPRPKDPEGRAVRYLLEERAPGR